MFLQVPWDTRQVLSLSTFAALEQVFLFKGAAWNVYLTYTQR